MKERKRSAGYFLLGLFVFFVAAFYFLSLPFSKVWAEDDEEVKTNVTTSTETISLPDSDGDGIIDKDDSHPAVAEIYVVEDKNLNGLVDKFEKDEE